jgi:hypothetical protein
MSAHCARGIKVPALQWEMPQCSAALRIEPARKISNNSAFA